MQDLKTQAQELEKGLKELDERLRGPRKRKGYVGGEWAERALSRCGWLLGPTWEPPTAASLAYLDRAERMTQEVLEDLNAYYVDEVYQFRQDLEGSGLGLLSTDEAVTLPK